MIKIYYGLSGTLKLTTIKNFQGIQVLSLNKPYQDLSKTFLRKVPTDLDLALIRLLQLRNLNIIETEDYHVERGITDFLEYWTSRDENKELRNDSSWIIPWIQEESLLLPKAKKVLLRMEDKEFIQDKVLKDPHRRAVLPDVDTYLLRQEEYVNFTKIWNKIDQEIIIKDAQHYLMNIKKWLA